MLSPPSARSRGTGRAGVSTSIESLSGTLFPDTLKGNDDPNTLVGLDGDDQLTGRGGSDVLLGGAGVDTFSGGGGTDTCDDVAGEVATGYGSETDRGCRPPEGASER